MIGHISSPARWESSKVTRCSISASSDSRIGDLIFGQPLQKAFQAAFGIREQRKYVH